LIRRAVRFLLSFAGVALVTWVAHSVVPLNATTAGFAYLLLVLTIATTCEFLEAFFASIASTLAFNFYFLPPMGTLTIADPQNRAALFSFLAASLVASRLRTEAKRRALDALARQQDVERMYSFSRSILLIDRNEPFARQLVRKLAEIFELDAVVLYERRTDEFFRAGPVDFDGMDEQLKDAALHGTAFSDTAHHRTITAIRLGSEPIGALALQGRAMPDSVLQGIANLAAIGLERARSQDLEAEIRAARQSEKLRTTLLDAMAHEFKTPLTSVMAATSALLHDPEQPSGSRIELLKIADEEAHRLKELIDDTVEMGRLDSTDIRVQAELTDIATLVREVVDSTRIFDDRTIQVSCQECPGAIAVDRRLLRLAIKQLLDNAIKYSPPETPVTVAVHNGSGTVTVEVTDRGRGIPPQEQGRIFQRLYRSPGVEHQIPGSGLGLSIALNIVRAHHGDLTVTSHPGETTFRMRLPAEPVGAVQ
jgi:two-component system, OmpR family, sensor histidine kinase KdpD